MAKKEFEKIRKLLETDLILKPYNPDLPEELFTVVSFDKRVWV